MFYGTLLGMFGLSGGHLLILAVVVLLFGRNRLPELGSAMGKGMHAFKKGLSGEANAKIEHPSNHSSGNYPGADA